MRRWLLSLGLTVLTAGSPAAADLVAELVASGIPYLVDIQHSNESGRLFLVSQVGRILVLDGGRVLPAPFLDISSLVLFSGERGLLGLAFHPDYGTNGLLFVHYTNPSNEMVLARYQASATDPNVVNSESGEVLLTIPQPFTNHKGGQIRFGPDGLLYIAMGDGGSSGDPLNYGQSLATLLGKLLRIDVNATAPFGVPASNPFVNTPGARGEIWAWGLRNPWRFSFDRLTGDLFIADVGQGLWEEVNMQPATVGGGNFGWRQMEGRHCYNPSSGCNYGTLSLPIAEYSHDLGCSVTGGFRYRGTSLSEYQGNYFFADYCTGVVWSAAIGTQGAWQVTQVLDTTYLISTFGEDAAGELYIANHASDGQLYRLRPGAAIRVRLNVSKVGIGGGRVTSSPTLLDCGDVCAAELATGALVNLMVSTEPGTTFAGWAGDADCTDGTVQLTTDRSCTAKFAAAFTDDALATGVTPIRTVHITELRSRINALRAGAGLTAFGWTDPVLTGGASIVQAVHITELRTAINGAFSALGQTLPTYTDPDSLIGVTVRAVHVTELRSAVLALELVVSTPIQLVDGYLVR